MIEFKRIKCELPTNYQSLDTQPLVARDVSTDPKPIRIKFHPYAETLLITLNNSIFIYDQSKIINLKRSLDAAEFGYNQIYWSGDGFGGFHEDWMYLFSDARTHFQALSPDQRFLATYTDQLVITDTSTYESVTMKRTISKTRGLVYSPCGSYFCQTVDGGMLIYNTSDWSFTTLKTKPIAKVLFFHQFILYSYQNKVYPIQIKRTRT